MVARVDAQAFFGLPPKGLRPRGPGENLDKSPDESSTSSSSSQWDIKPAQVKMSEDANGGLNYMCDTCSSNAEWMDIDMPHQLSSSRSSSKDTNAERRAYVENQQICSGQQETIKVLRVKNKELQRIKEAQHEQLDSAMEDLCAKSSQLREANEVLEDLRIENQILRETKETLSAEVNRMKRSQATMTAALYAILSIASGSCHQDDEVTPMLKPSSSMRVARRTREGLEQFLDVCRSQRHPSANST
jgi:hypothetical protein